MFGFTSVSSHRFAVLLMVLALLAGACVSSPGETTTTPPIADPKEPPPEPPPPSSSSSSSSSSSTSSTTKPRTTRELVDEAKEKMVEPEYVEGGKLAENGALMESAPDVNPFKDVTLHFYVDKNGRLNVYMEGPPEALRMLWVEFDAVDDDHAVQQETSYLGDQVEGPEWVPPTPKGSTRNVSDTPPPETPPGSPLGVVIPSDITTLEEWVRVSIWLYSGLIGGAFDFAHYQLLRAEAIRNLDDAALLGAFFSGLISLDPDSPDALAWLAFGPE